MYKRLSYAIAGTLALLIALALFGCSGGNSTAGDVDGGEEAARIAAVQVSDNGSTATMTVNFELSDDGAPLAGVDGGDIRFTVAKLIPASSPSSWQSYINQTETKEAGDPGTTPVGTTAFQATAERASTDGGIFTDNGDGTYSYTFSFNFRAVTNPMAVSYDPSLTHRVAMQVSDNVSNAIYDFVPGNPAATPATRSIVDNASCSECHEKFGFHGGDRVSVDYCVTCHNPGSSDANSGNTVNFTVMVHKIHFGENLPEVEAGGEYAIWGFNNTKHDYSTVVYPQDSRNCTKCHDGADAATPDGDNWKNVPSQAACTSCHETPDPAEYPTFPNLTADEIVAAHEIPSKIAATKFEYNIISITNTGPGQFPVVTVSVADPTNGDFYDILTDPAFTAGGASSLTVLIGWDTDDYTNTGSTSDPAQPISLDLLSGGTTDNNNGTFTVTSTVAIPAGITGSGVVALQGHPAGDFDGDGTYTDRVPVKNVFRNFAITDATPQSRRSVVDIDKCNNCHGVLSLHGNNRTDEIQVCVICHNANATDIEVRPGAPATGVDGKVEEAIDLKSMIHAIHAGSAVKHGFRENGIVVYGFRGSINDFSEVSLPSGIENLKNCERCHTGSTYEVPLYENALPTTILTAIEDDPTDDENITPTASVCASCHDGDVDRSHMEGNGAVFDYVSATDPPFVETCSVCHGVGKSADLAVAHRAIESTVLGVIKAPPEEDGGDSGGGGQTQVDLCGPGPISSQPGGHTTRLDCCSCHGFN
jgi:OmcA/MtrC family decaheme c-type cytochrome